MKLKLLCLLLCCSCLTSEKNTAINDVSAEAIGLNRKDSIVVKEYSPLRSGETIATRFAPPPGFKRTTINPHSFGAYLRNFKLKPAGDLVYLYSGEIKPRQDVHAAVLDISIGHRDLQQCADAIIRLRAEYLYAQKRFNEIHFNFTNGFEATYKKWRAGQRINVAGRKVTWVEGGQIGVGRRSFLKYLDMVFSYAGTLSLAKEMIRIVPDHMEIGDVFIQGGSPGHAVIVVDMAQNSAGETMFLLAQSYMPAQSIHVLNNLEAPRFSPWYSLKETTELITPEWVFEKNSLKRFTNF